MVTVIKRYEDADVMAFDYFIEAHHDVYEDTGHIVMKSSGGAHPSLDYETKDL